MSEKVVRVLHYIKHLEAGGGETLLYNIYKNIDREKVQFDFLVNCSKEEKLDSKIKELGGRKIALIDKEPNFIPLKIVLVMINLGKLLKRGEYQIIHIHCSNGQGLLYSQIAKLAGVPHIIVHIHNTNVDGKFIRLKKLFHFMCKLFFMNAPTERIACSELAAKWLYSDNIISSGKYVLLKNGIDIEKYKYNEYIRMKLRKEIGWENKKVLINVGRMEQEKNQVFLLHLLAHLVKIDNSYRLFIIGKGSLEGRIRKTICDYGLEKYVKLIPYTSEVEKYLWASDTFILPSYSEGLGIVAIEAQASGLKTIVSENIPKEAFVTDLIERLNLEDDERVWLDYIVSNGKNTDRQNDYSHFLEKAGFSIKETSLQLQNMYLNYFS